MVQTGPPRTLLVLLCAVTAVGCGSSGNPPTRIVVDKPRALVDTPLSIRVENTPGDGDLTVSASTTDAHGVPWRASATFRAHGGTLDLSRAKPARGSYLEADGMGLFWAMRPDGADDLADSPVFEPGDTERVVLRVTAAGKLLARRTVVRLPIGDDVDVATPRVRKNGFIGDYYARRLGSRRPAVVVLGGSEGGLSTDDLAALLASRGYPSLALAYFRARGLPPKLLRIPLEYFERALAWLRRRPEVDPKRLVVLGISRGSEAAILTATHYPRLVHGVVAYVPSAVVYPALDGESPAWTFAGRAIPHVAREDLSNPFVLRPRGAILQPSKINGPLFLVSANEDSVWESTVYANLLAKRLGKSRFRRERVLLNYRLAGHFVGLAIPYEPAGSALVVEGGRRDSGGSPEANAAAKADSWPKLLAFLARLRR
jgi:dienelactone hydrolase